MSKNFRIKPPLSHDNSWWWDMAGDNLLGIQRCTSCQTLRHPPRPMCGECRSMEWDTVTSSGKGRVLSYTVLHHPQFPGYEYPLIIVLVDLEEGTRLTAELKNCDHDKVEFGMPVEVFFYKDEDGFKIPMFRPSPEKWKRG